MSNEERILNELCDLRKDVNEIHEYVVGKPGQHGLVARQILHEQRTKVLEDQSKNRLKIFLGGAATLLALIIERAWHVLFEK